MTMNAIPSLSPAAERSPAGPERPRRFGRFGRLPQLAGTSFLSVGFLARLPLAMLTVGALTIVTSASGSYALGGFAAGAVGIGSALGAPILGFLADRFGQRVVLLPAAALNTVATVALVVLALALTGTAAAAAVPVMAAAFLTGFTSPQIGPLARVRWVAMTRRPSDLDTAMSYESTADELTFVLGPALVGLLASLAAPWVPLTLAAVLTLAMVSAFAVHPTGRLVGSSRGRSDVQEPGPAVTGRRSRLLISIPVLGMVAMGTFFGGTQTTLTAFAGQFDAASAAGLLYAVMGLSSAGAALSVAFWPATFAHSWRWIASAAGMVGLAALLFLPSGIPAMVLVLFLLGIPVGPTMVSIFSIGSMVAPRRLLGTVMTLLASGIVAGSALGSAVAGSLAERVGTDAAFAVPVLAAAALLVLGLAGAAGLRAHRRSVEATAAASGPTGS
nr:MFS transporter [Arthrobacter zhaoguopingii]